MIRRTGPSISIDFASQIYLNAFSLFSYQLTSLCKNNTKK